MIVATAGHVDHGKTELIRAITGVDTDRLPEEKARGLSIDLGFAYQTFDDGTIVGFVDVPGHEKFIRNMLAGVGGIDLGLLVVAADDGVMPQTREHTAILDLLGISQCLVAITKVDIVDETRILEVMGEVDALLDTTSMSGSPVFPVCAPRGEGLSELKNALEAQAAEGSARSSQGHFRLAVDRAFTLKGIGLVVTGMVFSGAANVDEHLMLSPKGLPVRVRGIRAHDRPTDRAAAGERCAINLAGRGLSESVVRRGDWIVAEELHAPTERVDVDLGVLPGESRSLKHWTPVHLHLGAEHVSARVAVLEGGSIAPGEKGLAQLVVERPISTVTGDRLVIRDQSAQRTVGGGRVVDPFSPRRGRARAHRLAWVRAMTNVDHETALAETGDAALLGVGLRKFRQARNLTRDDVDRLVDSLSMVRVGRDADETVFAPQAWRGLCEELLGHVAAWHDDHANTLGPNPNELRMRAKRRYSPDVIDSVLRQLVSEQKLARRGLIVHLPDHQVRLSGDDQKLWEKLEPALSPVSGSPPSLHQAAEQMGLEAKTVEGMLKRGVGAGLVVQIARNRYLPVDSASRLATLVQQLGRRVEQGRFTAADFRDFSGLGRNFAIDLLEYFDRVGMTDRIGDERRLHPGASNPFGDDK